MSFLTVYPSFSSCYPRVAMFLRRLVASSYEIDDGGWGSLLPSLANWSAVSFLVDPEYDEIHWRTIFLFLDSLLNCLDKVVDVLSVGFDCRVRRADRESGTYHCTVLLLGTCLKVFSCQKQCVQICFDIRALHPTRPCL